MNRLALPLLFVASAALAHEDDPLDAGVPDAAPNQTVVRGRRAFTAASSRTVRDEDFLARPIGDPSDILEITPGLFTVQHAGGGKANQFFLRGFDIDHGTDLALSVDGLPVNMVSHGHGQGYADLHFVIPELVERFEVVKGPYSAGHGDFATAGAVDFKLKRTLERGEVSAAYGSFEQARLLALVPAPDSDRFEGWGAAELSTGNGPFENPERLRRFNLAVQGALLLSAQTRLQLTVQGYGASWNASGQLPGRAVEAGTLSRFGSVDPTEGGQSARGSLRLSLLHSSDEGRFELFAYAIRYRLNLWSNFTFFLDDPSRGDQIEQTDDRTVQGVEGRYHRHAAWRSVRFDTTFGVRLRADDVSNGLFHAEKRERLEPRVRTDVREESLSAWVQEDAQLTSFLRVVGGVRGDAFFFAVEDALDGTRTDGSPSNTGARSAFAVSPKLSVVVSPHETVDLFANAGRGFHSNDARGVVRRVDPVTPLALATGYEVGARSRLFERIDLAAALWALDLDSELVWVGDEGTTEAKPASRRGGVELEARARLTRWLRADADLTYTEARFREEVAGGTRIPLAPRWTFSAGLSADHPSGVFGALRAKGISDRPANEDGSLVAQGFTLFDAQVGYRHGPFQVTLAGQNLANVEWRQAQFATESRLADEPAPVEEVHFSPGAPRSVSLEVAAFF